MPEQHVESVLNELKKFETHITNIGDAIIEKGVQSSRKLYDFAKEIKKIKGYPYSDAMLLAISNAIGVGLTDEEVTKAINDFKINSIEDDSTSTSIVYNKYKNNKNIKPIHIYSNVNTIQNSAFNGSNLRKLTAPNVTRIGIGVFDNCTELEELNLSSFNYKNSIGYNFSLNNCPKFKKLVVGDNSEISTMNFTTKLAVANDTFEIYTASGKKYNKSTYRFE
nr:MAG TPA: leucine rich repeat protein [Caudoviricetes sp.]